MENISSDETYVDHRSFTLGVILACSDNYETLDVESRKIYDDLIMSLEENIFSKEQFLMTLEDKSKSTAKRRHELWGSINPHHISQHQSSQIQKLYETLRTHGHDVKTDLSFLERNLHIINPIAYLLVGLLATLSIFN